VPASVLVLNFVPADVVTSGNTRRVRLCPFDLADQIAPRDDVSH
jgi:hypothetical protein